MKILLVPTEDQLNATFEAKTGIDVRAVRAMKLVEAGRVADGSPTPLLTAEAAAKGVTVAELAATVLGAAQSQAEALAPHEAGRQRAQKIMREIEGFNTRESLPRGSSSKESRGQKK